jgi:regulator of sigma E protease
MDILYTILAFLLLVGIVVTIHEGGHFFTAIYSGMKVVEFSIGFGPKILQKKIGKDQVLFTLRLFPLGGFVKPLDESLMSAEEWAALPESEKNRSFMNSPRWKKAAMVFGGPFSNFILAFIIFFIAFTIVGTQGVTPVVGEVLKGSEVAKSGLIEGDIIKAINDKPVNFISDSNSKIAAAAINGDVITITTERNTKHTLDFSNVDLKNLSDDLGQVTGLYFQGKVGSVVLKQVFEDGVAAKEGFKPGDIISSVNGIKINDLSKLLRIIRLNPGKAVEITYIRDGITLTKTVEVASKFELGTQVGKLGVELESKGKDQSKTIHFGLMEGISESAQYVVSYTWTNIISIKKMITGELSTKALSGPLSIADYSGKSAKRGLFTYLLLMASISIAVGVFNLMPVPMLDGGHLFQYAIETVRGKNFTNKQHTYFQYIGIAVMTCLFTFAIVNDIHKYLGFLG